MADNKDGGLARQYFEMLMDSQWWSAEALRDYQRGQLTHLLQHARQTTPFYEHRLDAVMNAKGDIDWDRWTEIPIIKRQDMIDHRAAMMARALPKGHGPAGDVFTSGSTSLPITITTNGLMGLASNANRWRFQIWNDIDWSSGLAVRLGNTTAPLVFPYGERKGTWGLPWAEPRGPVWEINVHLPPEHVVEFLRIQNCRYLNTGAAPAHVFALEAERLGLERPPLDAVLAQGASVGDADREAVKRVFGARLLETYSSKEAGQMAQPCEMGRLHVNIETCLVEIVDERGQPVPEGESGRVVVTPHYSTAQPLIRYEQGDIARVGGECPCGRHSPTLLAIEGRFSLFFTHPDGRKATSLLPDSGREALDCTFWQIAQVGPLDFEVRYVPNDWSKTGDEAEFIRIFRRQYFADARVALKRVDTIPLSPSGKYIEYKVEMSPAT
jgi:phenylacetate-CoA ligase